MGLTLSEERAWLTGMWRQGSGRGTLVLSSRPMRSRMPTTERSRFRLWGGERGRGSVRVFVVRAAGTGRVWGVEHS
jgi:hypothetical protein